MKKNITRNSFTVFCLSAAFLLLGGCADAHKGHGHDHEAGEEVVDEGKEGHHHSPDAIILSPEKAKAAGVEVKTISRGTFHDVIQTSGNIQAASCDETTIVASVGGVVSHAQHISEGMAIGKGTVIYRIKSDRLKGGDEAQRARLAYLAAKREYDRTLPLVQDKIITERDFSVIRSDYETARLAYEAIGKSQSGSGVSIVAPVTGYMKECMVKDGDYVEVGTPLMVITKNQHLYLRAEVPVRYYSELTKIRSAKFRTQYSQQVIDIAHANGRLMSSGKSAVSTSSYVPVTFQLDNSGDIVPGSYAEVFLITGERQNVLSVPTTALTEEQGVFYVYVQNDADSYRKQEVQLGATDGEQTEITSGLQGGEKVVVKGAINVKLAGASSAIPEHNHSH